MKMASYLYPILRELEKLGGRAQPSLNRSAQPVLSDLVSTVCRCTIASDAGQGIQCHSEVDTHARLGSFNHALRFATQRVRLEQLRRPSEQLL
jgi:hypothetical protein